MNKWIQAGLNLLLAAASVAYSTTAWAQKPPDRKMDPLMTVALEINKLEIHEGEPLPLRRCVVQINDPVLIQPGELSSDLCLRIGGNFLATDEEDPSIPGLDEMVDRDFMPQMDELTSSRLLRSVSEPIRALGPHVVQLDSQGKDAKSGSSSGPLYAPAGQGKYLVRVIAGWVEHKYTLLGEKSEFYSPKWVAHGFTIINILPAEKKLSMKLAPPNGTTVRVGEKFPIQLTCDIGGAQGGKLDVQIQCALRQKNPPKGQAPISTTKNGVLSMTVPKGGQASAVKKWTGNCREAGEFELEVKLTAPGFPPAQQTVSIIAQSPPEPPPATTGSNSKVRRWVREPQTRFLYDNDTHDAPPSFSGPGWSVVFSGNSMVVTEEFEVNGQKKSASNTIRWNLPPESIEEDQEFDMTMSSTRNKEGAGALGSLNCSRGDWVFVKGSPVCENWSVSWRDEPAAFYANISKTLKIDPNPYEPVLSVSAAPWRTMSDNAAKGCVLEWRYTETDEAAPSTTTTTGGGDKVLLEPDDEAPPLEAWLEPETVEASPRSGLYSRTEILIRGVKPNAAPVEVAYDTTDARGTLAMNRYLKVEGNGSRETGDMWEDNRGVVPWGLNIGANLGVASGEYQLPIIVRQPDHGEVKLTLTIRVLPRGNASSPATGTAGRPPVSQGQSGNLEARLELDSLILDAGGLSTANPIYVRGADSQSGTPIEIVFPQMAQNGSLPGGILVDPGSTQSYPYEKWPVDVENQSGWLSFGQTFRARSDAPAGTSLIEMIVKQKGVGEIPLRLPVTVSRLNAPGTTPGRPVPPSVPNVILPPPSPASAPDPNLAEGQALFEKGDVAGSLAAYDRFVRNNPDGLPGRMGRMYAHFWLQDFANAADDCRVVVRLDPENAAMRRFLALILLLQGQPDKAAFELDQLEMRNASQVENDPDFLLIRGQIQVAQNAAGQAQADFRRVMELDPQRPDKLYNDATAILSRGLLGMAILELDTALQLNPRHAGAWYALGDAYERKGQPSGSIRAYREYLKLDATSEWAQKAREAIARQAGAGLR